MQRDDADYMDWLTIRSVGRSSYLTRVAARTGLPIGLCLTLVATLGQLVAGPISPLALALETWFFCSGAIVLTVIAGWVEWHWLARKFD